MRLLIVDDDEKNRKLLAAMVGDLGQCDAVESGAEAVSAFTKAWEDWRPINLILLDLLMPEMDGRQVIRQIRSMEADKEISGEHRVKIIVVTAMSEKKLVIECLRNGCDDFILKPIDGQLLFNKIAKLGFMNPN
jgi:two-component system chemotaxis response regulator CheY